MNVVFDKFGGWFSAALVIVFTAVLSPADSRAAIREYTLVTNQSSITISGTVTGSGQTLTVEPQTSGSLTTTYSGSILADVTGSTIAFPGGSNIDANVSGNWQPQANGASGTASADYGGRASVPLLVTANFAGRNFVFDLNTDSPLSLNSNGNFGLSTTAATFLNGDIAYRITAILQPTQSGQESVVGEDIVLSGNGSLTRTLQVNGWLETLLIPIDTDLEVEIDSSTSADLNFAGQLRATALIPFVPGDFNGDGNVDGADFAIWNSNFPNSSGNAGLLMGDANGDGNVDGADFVVWQTNFPTVAGSITAVPEPSGALLALVGLGSIAALRQIRSQRRTRSTTT